MSTFVFFMFLKMTTINEKISDELLKQTNRFRLIYNKNIKPYKTYKIQSEGIPYHLLETKEGYQKFSNIIRYLVKQILRFMIETFEKKDIIYFFSESDIKIDKLQQKNFITYYFFYKKQINGEINNLTKKIKEL